MVSTIVSFTGVSEITDSMAIASGASSFWGIGSTDSSKPIFAMGATIVSVAILEGLLNP